MIEPQTALKNFLSYISVEKGLSENTVLAYKTDLLKFLNFAKQKNIAIESFSHSDITDFLWDMKNDKLSAGSIYRLIESIRQFYKFLNYDDLIDENPALFVKTPKITQTPPDTLTPAEIFAILNSVTPKDETCVRNRAMLELLYATALRVSELVNLKFSNIDLENKFVRIMGKGSKERLVPFGDKTKNFLLIYLKKRKRHAGRNDFVFVSRLGKKLSREAFWMQLKRIVINAGITKSVSPHTFRHSCASHLLKSGADIRFIQEFLGHSSISTTQIYTHLDKNEIVAKHKKFHPRG
jgi:integrase/recombinase XerD